MRKLCYYVCILFSLVLRYGLFDLDSLLAQEWPCALHSEPRATPGSTPRDFLPSQVMPLLLLPSLSILNSAMKTPEASSTPAS